MASGGGVCEKCKTSCIFREVRKDESKKDNQELFGFPCDCCKKVFCKNCSNISSTEIRALILTTRILPFWCAECIKAIKDAVMLADRIKELERKFKSLDNNVKDSTKDITKVKANVNTLNDKIININDKIKTKNGETNKDDKQAKEDSNIISIKQVEKAVSMAIASVRSSELSEPKKSLTTVGTGDPCVDFCGEEGKRWMYLGQVTKKSSPIAVRNYIINKLPLENEKQLEIEQLNTIGATNSFKVGIDSKYFDILNNNEFWPKNIIFRRFYIKKNRNQIYRSDERDHDDRDDRQYVSNYNRRRYNNNRIPQATTYRNGPGSNYHNSQFQGRHQGAYNRSNLNSI